MKEFDFFKVVNGVNSGGLLRQGAGGPPGGTMGD
jgi:hypothetical protein